jgi:hypothetical protein
MEVTVVCTGRGSHARHPFNRFTVADDGSFTMRQYRVGNEPDWKDLTDDDGATLLHTPILPVYEPRSGRGRWRWECPLCKTRRLFTTGELADWLRGKRVVDISVAPK